MNHLVFYIIAINSLDLIGVVAAKLYSLNKNPWFLFFTFLCFGLAGFSFALSLKYEGMAIVNVLWIAISVILVALAGYFIFKENITLIQFIGMGVIIVGLTLINLK